MKWYIMRKRNFLVPIVSAHYLSIGWEVAMKKTNFYSKILVTTVIILIILVKLFVMFLCMMIEAALKLTVLPLSQAL